MVAKFANSCSCSNQDLQKKTKKCLSAHKDLAYGNDILLYAIEREVIKLSLTADFPEVRERSFPFTPFRASAHALRMTTRPVILSVAKDLWCAFVQQT